MCMLKLKGVYTVQINGEGRLLGATECCLCTSDCDFWLLKAGRWAKLSKGERFFTSQLQVCLCQEDNFKCKQKPNHIQLHVEFQGVEMLCESQSPCLLSWCVFSRALLKRKMEFRVGKRRKRKSWQNR